MLIEEYLRQIDALLSASPAVPTSKSSDALSKRGMGASFAYRYRVFLSDGGLVR
jgi:hypothetical protein